MNNEVFSFSGACKVDDTLYFSASIFNGLIKYDLIHKKFEYIAGFCNCDEKMIGVHNKAFKNGDEIFFAPDRARGIHLYNMKNNSIEYIDLGLKEDSVYRGIDSVEIGEKIVIIPAYKNSPFFIFDKNSHTLKKTDLLETWLPDELKDCDKPIFWSGFSLCGNRIIGCVWNSSYLAEIDTDNFTVSFKKISEENMHFSGAAYSDGRYYFTCLNTGDIVSVSASFEDSVIIKNEALYLGDNVDKLKYTAIINIKDKVLLIPNFDKKIYVVDNTAGIISEYIDFPNDYYDLNTMDRGVWRRFFSYEVKDNLLYMFPSKSAQLLTVDVDNKTISGESMILDEAWLKKEYVDFIVKPGMNRRFKEGPVAETKYWNLSDMIKTI